MSKIYAIYSGDNNSLFSKAIRHRITPKDEPYAGFCFLFNLLIYN